MSGHARHGRRFPSSFRCSTKPPASRDALARARAVPARGAEVIVVDGGSRDGTVRAAPARSPTA